MLMSFCMTGAVFAQKGMIKGTVVDENGEPVIGANVLVKGTTNGTIPIWTVIMLLTWKT